MEIKLRLNKNINDNANIYFDKAKKLKSKIPGLQNAIEQTKKEILEFEEKKSKYISKKQNKEKLSQFVKKEWYDKFRWTKTTGDFLLVIGKDASTNEILIKKHLEPNDLVFHTEAPGSPFGILKGAKDKADKKDLEEAGEFISCFSKQWTKGYGTADAFYIFPEQITKKAQSGEYISKGSFMIYGKKNSLKNLQLKICLGIIINKINTGDEEIEFKEIFSGSEMACKKYCKIYIKLEPGKDTYKNITKEIKKRLQLGEIEDLPKYIPNNCKILKK